MYIIKVILIIKDYLNKLLYLITLFIKFDVIFRIS